MNKFLLITLTACLPLILGFATAQRSPALAPATASDALPIRTLPQLPGNLQLGPNNLDGCVWIVSQTRWLLVCKWPNKTNVQ